MRTSVMLVMGAAAAGAIGASALRPRCATAVTVAAAPRPQVAFAAVAAPSVIAHFPAPAAAQPGRNVFAFADSVWDRRPRCGTGALACPVSPAPAQRTEEPADGQARAPCPHVESPYRYLGSFGAQEVPILVYKGNGEVVNVVLRKP